MQKHQAGMRMNAVCHCMSFEDAMRYDHGASASIVGVISQAGGSRRIFTRRRDVAWVNATKRCADHAWGRAPGEEPGLCLDVPGACLGFFPRAPPRWRRGCELFFSTPVGVTA